MTENVQQTIHVYPDVRDLRKAVLDGRYNDKLSWFSRGYLWKSLALDNSDYQYKPVVKLEPVPVEPATILVSHSKVHHLTPTVATMDPLNDRLKEHVSEQEALDIIKLDLKRLILDPIFQDPLVHDEILQILYNFNKRTSYKQGYHEICGVIYLNLRDFLSGEELKITTFNVLTSIMLHVTPVFYSENVLINWCKSFDELMGKVDPVLYTVLIKTHRIESQIWLIRWVRMLFLREVSMGEALSMWDYMLSFSSDVTLLVPSIILVKLMQIKTRLVKCEDQGECLFMLLHYPHESVGDTNIMPLAMELYNSSDPAGMGARLNTQFNSELKHDVNRMRLEEKLRRRVEYRLKK